jgi:hypothetical protein
MPSPPSSGLTTPAEYDASRPDVVLDVVTGLMWQQSAAPPDQEYAFDDALAYCAELQAGGYCDWRLPSRIELISLVDFTRADPAIDTSVFEDASGIFFSASVARGTDARWGVASTGATSSILNSGTRAGGRSVRCVRTHTPPQIPEPRYAIEGQSPDQSVVDRGTGLVWKASPSAGTYTYDEALAHCASVGAGWRLPNVKELQTIVDETRLSGPAIDEQVFVGFPQQATAIFWSSSPSVTYPGTEAWFVNFATGVALELSLGSGVQTPNYVRCVR